MLQTDGRTEGHSIYCANIASRGRNDGKTTSSGGESVGSGALPDCLDFRFCARMVAMSTRGAAFLFTFMLCNLDSVHCADIASYRNKKLSYRRGTARRAMSVKTVLNVAQTFVELHLISPATGEWPSRSFKVIGNGTNRILSTVVCSINVSILCHFFDTTTLRCTWLPVGGLTLKSL